MSDLIVIAFDDEADAFALRRELVNAQGDYLVHLQDSVVVTRPTEGEYQLHQSNNLTAAGALGGGFWGGLIGLLFLNPLLGVAVGAGAGALAGSSTDYGIDDDFIRQIGKTVPVGSAAVFILSSKIDMDKLVSRLADFGGHARVIRTVMSDADESRLRGAFDAAAPATGPVATTVRHPDAILPQATAADPGFVIPPVRLPGSDQPDE